MTTTLTKIISGGQTGVDIAALRAAQAVGLATGGWMPLRFRTLVGPKPEYAARYGLREAHSRSYSVRTHNNVRDADATMRLAVDFDSAGERCTWMNIVKHRKQSLDIDFWKEDGRLVPVNGPDIAAVVAWLRRQNVATLNVAGNSEHTAPGIKAAAEAYLTVLFRAALDDAAARR